MEEVTAHSEVQVLFLGGQPARASPSGRRRGGQAEARGSALLAQLAVLRAAQDGLHDAGPEEAVADPAPRLLAGHGREGRARRGGRVRPVLRPLAGGRPGAARGPEAAAGLRGTRRGLWARGRRPRRPALGLPALGLLDVPEFALGLHQRQPGELRAPAALLGRRPGPRPCASPLACTPPRRPSRGHSLGCGTGCGTGAGEQGRPLTSCSLQWSPRSRPPRQGRQPPPKVPGPLGSPSEVAPWKVSGFPTVPWA